MPSEEWWENLEEPLQRPGQMQKHEPRFGYTELRLDPCCCYLCAWLSPGSWKKLSKVGIAGAVVRPRRGREDGAVPVLDCLAWSGLVWSWSVLCRALPCRAPWSAGLRSVFEIYYVSRQSSKLQTVDIQGREIDEADLGGRMPRYQGTYDCERQQQQGVGQSPCCSAGAIRHAPCLRL